MTEVINADATERHAISRRGFLLGTAGLVASSLAAPAAAVASHSPAAQPLACLPGSALHRTLPVDVRSAWVGGAFADIPSTQSMIESLGFLAVRDLVVPRSQQQSAALRTWREHGIRVVGIVSRAGDTEDQVRRRVRAAGNQRPALSAIEFHPRDGSTHDGGDGSRLHFRLGGVAAVRQDESASAQSAAGSVSKSAPAEALRLWLSDIAAAIDDPTRPTPEWPLFGKRGLLRETSGGWAPNAAGEAIARLLGLAHDTAHRASSAVTPILRVAVPRGISVRAWTMGSGKTLVTAWGPAGYRSNEELAVVSSRAVTWSTTHPARGNGGRHTHIGTRWRSRIGTEPVAVVVEGLL